MELKEVVNETIAQGFKELFLPPNLMLEAVSWLSPERPHTNRLQLFSKEKILLLTITAFDEVENWDEYKNLIEGGRSDATEYLWEIN